VGLLWKSPIFIHLFSGIGGNVSIYNYYVPIYSKNYLEIKKNISEALEFVEQAGSGQDSKDTSSSENNAELSQNSKRSQDDENVVDDLNKSLKIKMDPKIYESFQKPNFVKTGEILFSNKRKVEKANVSGSKKTKLMNNESNDRLNFKHKFQFHNE